MVNVGPWEASGSEVHLTPGQNGSHCRCKTLNCKAPFGRSLGCVWFAAEQRDELSSLMKKAIGLGTTLRAAFRHDYSRIFRANFKLATLARKPTLIEKGLLLGSGRAAKNAVAMGKAAEPADDIGVVLGIFQVFGVAGFAEEIDAIELVG
jgi:hypothetical protein